MSYELCAGVESSWGGVGSAGIGNHPPLLGLVGSAGAVAAGGTVGLPALATVVTIPGVAVGAFGPADDRPGAGGGLAGAAFAVQLDDDVGAQGGVLLVAADPLVQLGRRPRPGRERFRLRAANTGSSGGATGWPLGWRAAAMARWRTASGLRVGMPRPWRPKALRSDGQVVSNSLAAAFTLPSCSASA
jgi:hypothetical protein